MINDARMSYTYIASPFSHPSFFVRLWRFILVCRFAAKRMRTGEVVFSPIAHSFPIELFMRRQSFEFWMGQDIPLLDSASKIIVLKIKGWDESKGVTVEVERAANLGIPMEFIEP